MARRARLISSGGIQAILVGKQPRHGMGGGTSAREPSMTVYRGSRLISRTLIAGAFILSAWSDGRCDSVIMKSGVVYRSMGAPDRDNTLVYISDGLKRVVVRDSKIERIEANNAFRGGEKFQLVQPLVVHGGLMPKEVVSVEAGPWDERGRRTFRYIGSRLNKPIRMEQAIIEIGPHIVKIRGVDGFWVGLVETDQIPRPVVTSLLRGWNRKTSEERERVVRFLDGHRLERRGQERARSIGPNDFPQAGPERAGRKCSSSSSCRPRRSDRRSEIDVQPQGPAIPPRGRAAQDIQREGRSDRASDRGPRDRAAPGTAERGRPGPGGRPAQAWRTRCRAPSDGSGKGRWSRSSRPLPRRPTRSATGSPPGVRPGPQSGNDKQALFALAMSGYVAGPDHAVPDLRPPRRSGKHATSFGSISSAPNRPRGASRRPSSTASNGTACPARPRWSTGSSC